VVVVPPGKRHALAVGIREARSDVVVLTDSDPMWHKGFLRTLMMGFADTDVGGVGCRQNVYRPGTSLWRRVADWMLDVRYLHYLPAMARNGAIPCISGRTAAYRRAAVLPVVAELEYETFWGKRCISGDDGRLTWLILRDGWKAGYQINARAWTVFPNTFRGFVKQRVRWSRNSYRCYLRAMWRGWLWRQPVITSVSVIQNLVGPFTLMLATYFLIVELLAHRWGLAVLVGSWLMLGRAIKGVGHLFSEPEALLFLPLITVVFIVVMIPVKLYALVTLNKQGWITRREEGGVAEGQSSATLGPLVPVE
jgi:hyaluronan synthase